MLCHGHLRKKKSAKHAGVNEKAVGPDLNFFYRRYLFEWRKNRNFNANTS